MAEHQVGRRVYLIFSALPEFFSKAFQERYADILRGFSSYAMVGDSLFGPFQIHGSGQIIPPDHPVQPYANQLVFWQGGAYMLGTVWNDDQDFICDPLAIEFTGTGICISH